MGILSVIIAIIALIVAILAYQKGGGTAELRKRIDWIGSLVDLGKSLDSLTSALDTLRENTVEAVERLEDKFRRGAREEKKPTEHRPLERVEEPREETPPTAQDFQNELDRTLAFAQQEGRSFVEIKSGDLHRSTGGYPGRTKRMPTCCAVMKRNMKPGDEILEQPASGQGATLRIRFSLPR